MIIAVDFDGTIVQHDYPRIGKVMPFAFETLKKFKEKHGDELILWTCREGKELQEALDYCKQNGLVFDAVNENLSSINIRPRKIFAHWYIDDKANDEYINWKHLSLIRSLAEGRAVKLVAETDEFQVLK